MPSSGEIFIVSFSAAMDCRGGKGRGNGRVREREGEGKDFVSFSAVMDYAII